MQEALAHDHRGRPEAEAAKDLIERHFGPCEEMDRRYVGDITYISTWEGWAYLATVIDLAVSTCGGLGAGRSHAHRAGRPTPSPWRSPTADRPKASSSIPTGAVKVESTGRRNTSIMEVWSAKQGTERRKFAYIGGISLRRDDPEWRGERTGSSSGRPSLAA